MLVWFLSWLATVLTIGFFLSGFITCRSMVEKRSTENIQFLPFVTTLANCFLWATYGVLKSDSTLMVVNSVGASLQIIYILCFLYFTSHKTTQMKFLGFLSLAGLIVYLYMMHFITENKSRTYQMGKLCTVVTITMMASPLATMAKVFRTKSTESMQFPFSLMITIVSFIWVCYGFAVDDSNIQLPNAIGVILGLLQLLLFYLYPFKPSKMGVIL
ncbi:sugar transporter SWEET1-like [Actinia tenebrosa]|uniref:Sugar transporter SWEET1 n=1 Tax=Actinia tenebrosa TaxID=6105 RepID=A0A6P8IQA2_ACTTE|nr:sugar transporter SWEET1-like [Actinia tenebrosa]